MKLLPFRQAIIIALLASSAIIVPPALAADYTVSTPTTAQNGGVGVLNTGDSLTVTGTGSIDITSPVFGISTTNNGVTINNAGSITIGTSGLFGISVMDSNIITNSGTVSTTGGGQSAISALGSTPTSGNIITNSGTINTIGITSNGIYAAGWNTISNSGVINIFGDVSMGVSLSNNNLFTNSGKINTTGPNSFGVLLSTNNTFTNSGKINTTGNVAFGVTLGTNNVFTNSGTIETTGPDAYGIYTSDDNKITNSGKVVSAQSFSFYLDGAGNILNLSAPAFIGSQISLGADTAVNVITGRSHSVLWDFSTHTNAPGFGFSGPVPWAWDAVTEKFATIDPTALSATPDMLADMTGSLSDLTRANPQDSRWWLNGYGNFSSYGAQGIYNDYNNLDGGIATGASFAPSDNFTLGAMIGYMGSNLTVNSKWMTSQTIKGNGVAGGIYGNARTDNMFVDFAVFAGARNNSSSRLVNDNLAPLGVDYASASYNSWFVSPQLRVGVDVKTGDDWTLTPSASARFSSQQIAGYTETGSNANATIAQRQVQVVDAKLELAATRKLENGSLTLKGGAQFRQNLGGATQNVTLLGQTLAIPLNIAGTIIAYAGADTNFAISDTGTLNLGVKAAIGQNNFKSLSAVAGFSNKLL